MFSSRMEFPNLLFLCLFFCLFLSECNGQPYKPSTTCARLECPQYTVVHTEKDFEIRSYKKAVWVSSPKIESNSYSQGSNKGFLILFTYIKGKNQQNVKIDMTAPVLIDIQNSTYTTHFYVPEKYQKSVPQPISKYIKQEKLPRYNKYAAVRRFGGYLSSRNIPIELDALKKSLQGTPYKRAAAAAAAANSVHRFTVAGYNAPWDLFFRVNEVILWFD